jgi:hypothetical protein
MSNCINCGINKVYILTQFNSASLNRHISRAYNFGGGVTFGDGYCEVHFKLISMLASAALGYVHSSVADGKYAQKN